MAGCWATRSRAPSGAGKCTQVIRPNREPFSATAAPIGSLERDSIEVARRCLPGVRVDGWRRPERDISVGKNLNTKHRREHRSTRTIWTATGSAGRLPWSTNGREIYFMSSRTEHWARYGDLHNEQGRHWRHAHHEQHREGWQSAFPVGFSSHLNRRLSPLALTGVRQKWPPSRRLSRADFRGTRSSRLTKFPPQTRGPGV